MLFALYINSASVVVPVTPEGGGRAGGAADTASDLVGALRLFDVGPTTMHFAHHDSARLLGVVMTESSLGEQIGLSFPRLAALKPTALAGARDAVHVKTPTNNHLSRPRVRARAAR